MHHSNLSLKDLLAKNSIESIDNIDKQLQILNNLKEMVALAAEEYEGRISKDMMLGRTSDEDLHKNIIKTYLRVFKNIKEFMGEAVWRDREHDCEELINQINKELHKNKENYIEKASRIVQTALMHDDYKDSMKVMCSYSHADAHTTLELYKNAWGSKEWNTLEVKQE